MLCCGAVDKDNGLQCPYLMLEYVVAVSATLLLIHRPAAVFPGRQWLVSTWAAAPRSETQMEFQTRESSLAQLCLLQALQGMSLQVEDPSLSLSLEI